MYHVSCIINIHTYPVEVLEVLLSPVGIDAGRLDRASQGGDPVVPTSSFFEAGHVEKLFLRLVVLVRDFTKLALVSVTAGSA